jgi:hypothetical protein
MSCAKCPRWQGTRRSTWADCNYVVCTLVPNWKRLRTRFGFPLRVPFDPHDCKYVDPLLRTVLEKRVVLPKGVRSETIKEDDIVYDDQGGERVGKVKVTYFQTRKDYDCGADSHTDTS